MNQLKACVFLLLLMLHGCHSVKVMLVPMNMGSHFLYIGQVASALVENGHSATMYIPANNKPPAGMAKGVRIIKYQVPDEMPYFNTDEVSKMEIAAMNAESTLEWISVMEELQVNSFAHINAECEALFDVFDAIKQEGYELAIMDGVSYPCYYAIPYKLNIPYVSVSIPYAMWLYRVPHLSSQYPTLSSTHGQRMNFWQRLFGFSMDVLDMAFTNSTDYYIKKYVPEKPTIDADQLLAKSSMWWYLYDLAIGYPKPTMPNTLDIGDIMTRPAKPLNEEFLTILQESSEGVILVSLGSHFDAVPEEWLREFCSTFNSIKYTVIWKLKVKLPCEVKPNVHIKPWVPQNDLLAHPKLLLFITHCGYNSLLESVSHGKPVVGFPLTLDQPYNAQILKDKQMAQVLDIKTFTSRQLVDAIDHVLSNETYTENTRLASKLLKSKLTTPGERVSFWAQHIVDFGSDHLFSTATDLNLMQFLMVDIYLFIFTLLIVCMVLGLFFLVGIKRLCIRCCRKKTDKTKSD